jgi:hypothetical protein
MQKQQHAHGHTYYRLPSPTVRCTETALPPSREVVPLPFLLTHTHTLVTDNRERLNTTLSPSRYLLRHESSVPRCLETTLE